MDIERTERIPFELATVAEVLESGDPTVRELYVRSEPLVRGVFPFISYDEYQGMTTRRHVTFAKVAARSNPKLLAACDLTLTDLGLDDG